MAENKSTIYEVTYWDPETNTFRIYTEAELNALRSDNLKLSRINRNGTISEMMDTIDQNFQNIAAHGGGPAGFDGADGINGADGTSAQYIFALCDEEPERGTDYPIEEGEKNNLFDAVEFTGKGVQCGNVEWFDHPQGVTKDHKNEYVFSRYVVRIQGETKEWKPAEKPVLWSHWGETGKDGDGVEYIFMRSRTELDESTLKTIIKSKESMSGDQYQPVIYQMDDFFPGEEWFTGKNSAKNKANAQKAIIAKYGNLPSTFDSLWSNKFNMIVPGYNWTDDPKGTDPINVYEYVAIRRCNVDDEDGKEWSDFSTPAIWSHYGLSTRTIIIYCNKEGTTPPVQPQTGQGTWNESSGELTLPDSLVDAGWSDTNTTPSENQITWMCSGIFDNSGKNVSWSKPMRITGKDGKQGEDGTTIEFIYVLSEHMPEHPDPTTTSGKTETEKLFNDVEASTSKPKSVDRYGNTWFDRAQPISQSDPTEWVWSRRREKESDPWEYDDDPIIWAHWGEDGTDGDGVEYIFYITDTETFDSTNNPPKVSEITGTTDLDKCKKLVYNMDDFYPDEKWFDDNETKIKNIITDAGYDESNYAGVKTFFDKGWRDNPIKVSPMNPYQWVSIRRSHADEETGGKRQWEDFSEPVLWNTYGQATRVFMIYCNVRNTADPDIAPRQPQGGFWNVNPGTGEVLLAQDKDHLTTPYQYDVFESGVTAEDRNNHINVWEDDNIDVPGTITWVSSGVFTTDGKLVDSWSQPFRITGYRGENGADGSNIEFIYALCDDEPQYPTKGSSMTDTEYKAVLDEFFDDVNASDNEGYWPKTGNDRQKWTDNPQGISDDPGHKTEWVWQRSLPSGLEDVPINWVYMPAPVIWSRWGEDGTDGDGVEYIFYAGTSIDGHMPNVNNMTNYQAAIYQISDFYPGEGWFTDGTNSTPDNKTAAQNAIIAAGLEIPSNFESLWSNKFGLNSGWTDNPSGVSLEKPFEWVSIRKTINDPEDSSGKKWGRFSTPKIWAKYNIETRVFIIYYNANEGDIVNKPTGGWWDVVNDELRTNVPDHELTPGWSDTNVDVPGKIAYLSSGIFSESGENLSWSKPFRITGEKGRSGADGSTIEFVYCLSEEMPAYPEYDGSSSSYDYINTNFFDVINTNGSMEYTNTSTHQTSVWYDNPQGINETDRKEWVWSRSKSAVTGGDPETETEWTFPPTPVIWAHWGEDGTDGDGVEYIFFLQSTEGFSDSESAWNNRWSFLSSTSTSDDILIKKAVYSMDDFYPSVNWFDYGTNKDDVREILKNKYNKTFTDSAWDTAWTDVRTSFGWNWRDNPGDVTASLKYQYVSIRKTTNDPEDPKGKEWGAFSYPKLWSKYSITSFTEFAFTATTPEVNLSNYTPTGGNFSSPRPTSDYQSLGLVWTDGPTPVPADGKIIIWMTSAKFKEDVNASTSPIWSKCQRMADTSTFQVEWSSQELSDNDLITAKNTIDNAEYNFGLFLANANYDADLAESNWRTYVTTNLGINFGDTSGGAVLMATCQEKNGVWTPWKLDRVKGERGPQGEAGTSINVKGRIQEEVYLESGVTYTYQAADQATKPNGEKVGDLLIVYPHNVNSDGVYYGTNDGTLYMWEWNGTTWVDFNTSAANHAENGDSYVSPNKHLIMWDGTDSWFDIGELQGPEGTSYKLLIRYANGDANNKTYVVNEALIPYAKWIGTLTYIDGDEDPDNILVTDSRWKWSLFKGQDGHGYEYIYIATSKNNPVPDVPTTTLAEDQTDDHVPTNWSDEPIEPNSTTHKYIWMCWRKYDYTNDKWTKFIGSNKLDSEHNGKAILWQVYAKGISNVTEYFHADSSISPDSPLFTAQRISGSGGNSTYWDAYWVNYKLVNPDDNPGTLDTEIYGTGPNEYKIWGTKHSHLFNREVVTYSDNTKEALDPHYISEWGTGIKDVVDYYILEPANGTQGDGDPGDVPPHIVNGKPTITESGTAGEDYWTTSVPKMDEDYPVLWNISKKIFDGGKEPEWTTPIVIGIYGQGTNGEDSIYADLDNEMDSIQIDENNKILVDDTYNTTVRLYSGSTLMRIDDIDISGEEAIMKNGYTLTYYYDDGTNLTKKGEVHFRYNSSTQGFTTDGNDPIGTVNLNINCIKITFTVSSDASLSNVYSKVIISVGHSEGNNETARRNTSYTFIGTTHPYVYSIIPSESAIIFSNNTRTPNPLYVSVVRQVGKEKTVFDTYSSTQGFDLNYTITQDNAITSSGTLSNGSFRIATNTLNPGDYITFAVNVDNDDNHSDRETTLDRETVYVLREGEPGTNGNGYRYYYARYVNAMSSSYGTATIPTLAASTLSSDTPIFLLNNISLPASSNALGAEESYPYEYRVERYYNGTSWENWSNPITIAKYLTATNISKEVQAAVSNATTAINNNLTNAVNRLNTLEGYIDPSTGVFSGTVSDSTKAEILYGYATTSDVSSAISSINLGGLKVDASGTETFSEWYNSQNSTLTDVATRMSAAEGTLSTAVTTTQLSNVTTAFENYKADAHDQFAQMDRTVANANYLTDTEGYLLVNVPEYVTWFRNETEMNGDYKDTDKNRDVEWIMFSGTIYDTDDPETQTVVGPFETSPSPTKVSYDNLFNESKDKITFVLEESIYPDNINFRTFNLNSFKPTANSVEIEYDIETEKYIIKNNTSNLGLRIPFNNNGTPNYTTSDGTNIICLIYVTCDLNNPTSKSGMKYTFTNLNWNIGISSMSSSCGPDSIGQFILNIRYACTKTASIFESPVLAGSVSDTFTCIDKYKQYGATLTSTGDPVTTNGNVSLSPNEVELLPVINEATGTEWSVKDIMGYLTDGTTPITSSDLLSFDDTIYVDESKEFYMLWKRNNESSGGIDDFLNEYNVVLTGDNTKNRVSFDDRAFVNKHELTLSSGFDDYTDGQRRVTGNGGTEKYDWYEMYLTSSGDEVKLDYNITFTNTSGSFVFRIDYYFGDEDPGTYESVNIISGNYSSTKTFSGNVSIFEGINLESNTVVHFRVYLKPSTTTTSYDVSYKITSVNKFLDSEGGPIFDPVDLTIDGSVIPMSNYTTTTGEYDSTLPWPEIPGDVIYINTIDYTFKPKTGGYGVIAVFKLQSSDINTKGKLYFYSNNDNLQYIVLPANYDENTVKTLIENCTDLKSSYSWDNGGFLENEIYGTIGKYSSDWHSVNSDPTYDLEFINDSINIGDDINSVTVILYMDGSNTYSAFNVQVAYVNETEITWNTDETDKHKRHTNCSGGMTYMVDKFSVTIGDRSRIGDVPYTKRKAKDKTTGSNDPGVKNYIDVLDSDKPYLILSVSELATISQMVSDGIASTSIIAKAGDSTAVFFEQAVDGGGSQIYMNANEIGIESDYFKLDNNGLRLTGNLYAKNTNKNITAGVIGDSSPTNDGVKFFAGITLPDTYTDDQIKNRVRNAKFYVTEKGHLHAEDVDISGNITANSFSATDTHTTTFDDETYSIKRTSIINSDKFEITSTAIKSGTSTKKTAKIYIAVVDKIEVTDGDVYSDGVTELKNVPTLCMTYPDADGNELNYYLTPDMWKSFIPKTYYDVKIFVENSHYSISVTNYTGTFYVEWMLYVEEIGKPSNNWTINSGTSSTECNNYTGDMTGYFGDSGTSPVVIPTNLLGKNAKISLSLLSPVEFIIATKNIGTIPNKSDISENVLDVFPTTPWEFTYTDNNGWQITGGN